MLLLACLVSRSSHTGSGKTARNLSLRVRPEVFVLETLGHSLGSFVFDFFRRRPQRFVSFAVFLARYVCGGVGEWSAPFGEADEFDGLLVNIRWSSAGSWVGRRTCVAFLVVRADAEKDIVF